MDFVGPIIPSSSTGNKYILVITDLLSKFVIAKTTRDNSAITAANIFVEDMILKYGVPNQILTDNGSHFTAELFNAITSLCGVCHIYTTPYHPQSNGVCERFNASMCENFASICNKRKNRLGFTILEDHICVQKYLSYDNTTDSSRAHVRQKVQTTFRRTERLDNCQSTASVSSRIEGIPGNRSTNLHAKDRASTSEKQTMKRCSPISRIVCDRLFCLHEAIGNGAQISSEVRRPLPDHSSTER